MHTHRNFWPITGNYILLFLLFTIILTIFSASCSPESKPIVTQPLSIDSTLIKEAIKREQDSTYISFFLQEFISGVTKEEAEKVKEEEIFSKQLLPYLYDSLYYQLIWYDDSLRRQAINLILDSENDGLFPEDYHINKILELEIENSDSYEERSALDLLITDAIILYGNQLLNGKTDANSFEPTLSRAEKRISDPLFKELCSYILNGQLSRIIEKLRPTTPYYSSMMEGLKKYKLLADSGGWDKIYTKVRKIEPGDELRTTIPKIRKRMMVEGDLVLRMDSLTMDSIMSNPIYDSLLLSGVQRFQMRHGLNPDGVIGKATIEMMNISAEEKVKLLKTNLERARWVYHDLPKDYIFVNIPAYDLRYVKDSSLVWITRIVAGTVASATPIFMDEMQYIVFNPNWTVPSSIANYEILPKIKKDSTFLTRNNMELISGSGKQIDASKVDFSSIKQGEFPFIVKQGPGAINSLGRVKFIFPNPHYIYLHDTPSRGHFARERRAFSHGCIRVKDPIKLSELILEDQEISRDSIDNILKSEEATRLNLDTKLPVYITYSTAFAEDSIVYFYADVYKRDEPLMDALGLN